EVHFRIEEFAYLPARDLHAAPGQVKNLCVGIWLRAGDDGAVVKEHARKTAHPRAADTDKMDSLAGEMTCRARLRSQLAHYRLHDGAHDTASGRSGKGDWPEKPNATAETPRRRGRRREQTLKF